MSVLKCQGILFKGHSKFLPINDDYEYFIYDGYVFDIKDFEEEKYTKVDLDKCKVPPVCTIEEWYIMNADEREYYNSPNLYGPGTDIHLDWPEQAAVLITNAKGF